MQLRILITGVAIAGIPACGPGTDPRGEQQQHPSVNTQMQPIDEQKLEQLEERYPRLGTEPQPEPKPSASASLETSHGEATYYAQKFEGRRTASGIPFRQNQMVAAHRAYPFGTILRVTNTQNGRTVNVRVVDRGPFGNSGAARRAVIDLSRRAAEALGYVASGRTPVRVEVLEWGRGLK